MPQTKRKSERVHVRLPKPMVDEVDRLVEAFPEFSYNRQQFIESAIREKIEKMRTVRKREN